MARIMAFLLEALCFALLLWCAALASVFVHEMGHAAGHRLAGGGKNWSVVLGSGGNLCRIGKFRINRLPVGGVFQPAPERQTAAKMQRLSMLAGGPLASMLLTVFLVLMKTGLGKGAPGFFAAEALDAFFRFSIIYNFSMLMAALLPFRYGFGVCRGLESDGRQILALLRDSHV